MAIIAQNFKGGKYNMNYYLGIYRFAIITFMVVFSLYSSAYAREKFDTSRLPDAIANEDGQYELCDKLKKKSAYKGWGASYYYLLSGKNGWIFRNRTDFRQDFSVDDDSYEYIRRYGEVLRNNGTDLYILISPTRGLTASKYIDFNNELAKDFNVNEAAKSYRDFLNNLRKKADIEAIPLDSVISDENIYFKMDLHWNDVGADKIAKIAAEYIKDNSSFKDIPEKNFVTEKGEKKTDSGGFREYIAKVCKINIPPEYNIERKTYLESGKDAEFDLFGDDEKPSIVLLGTSNSNIYTNFEGALKEHLQADIDNRAINGGGIEDSALNYMLSGDYNRDKPKIIIWEMMPYFKIHNYHNLFRQLIPSIYGECSDENTISAVEAVIKGKETPLFRDLDISGKNISGNDNYLYLDISESEKRNLAIHILYADGSLDEVEIKNSDRMKIKGKYFYELSDKNVPVMHITVTSDVHKGNIKAKICKAPR